MPLPGALLASSAAALPVGSQRRRVVVPPACPGPSRGFPAPLRTNVAELGPREPVEIHRRCSPSAGQALGRGGGAALQIFCTRGRQRRRKTEASRGLKDRPGRRRDAKTSVKGAGRARISSKRAAAVVQLERISSQGAYVSLLTRQSARKVRDPAQVLGFALPTLDNREVRQVRNLVSGVTRWRRWLDFIVSRIYDGDLDKMESILRQILRVGVFELTMTTTARYAAVADAVELAKVSVGPHCGALVNFILRETVRCLSNGTLPDPSIPADADKRRRERALAKAQATQMNGQDARPRAASDSTALLTQTRSQPGSKGGGRADPTATQEALAIRYSHPTWMCRRWCGRYGEEDAVKLMIQNNRDPTYSIRSNIEKGPWAYGSAVGALNKALEDTVGHERSSEVHSMPSGYAAGFVRVASGLQVIVQSGLLSSGQFSVQDEAAGLVVYALNPSPGDVVVDACAAPGGKATLAAMIMRGRGALIAIDINESRLELVRRSADEQGYSHMMRYHAGDFIEWAHAAAATGFQADKVLLDAPCSGLGVLAKRADLRWNRSEDEIEDLTQLQDNLLDAACKVVRPGGLLLYSTCSIEPEENSKRVKEFLKRHGSEFEPESCAHLMHPQLVGEDGNLQVRSPAPRTPDSTERGASLVSVTPVRCRRCHTSMASTGRSRPA